MKRKSFVFLALFMLIMTGCGAAEKESADAAANTEVYSGTGYTLSYDPDKWELSVYTDDVEESVTFERRDYDDVEFTIVRIFDNNSDTLNDFLEHYKKMGELDDDITYKSGEIISINEWNWSRAELQESCRGHMINYVLLYTVKNSYWYRVDFSAEDPGYYECLTEFEEIFDSFEFT